MCRAYAEASETEAKSENANGGELRRAEKMCGRAEQREEAHLLAGRTARRSP